MEPKSHANGVSIVIQAISTVLGLSANEINNVAEDSSFVRLGGDSLAAIIIAAECQKGGISISASVLLLPLSLRDVIVKAASSAQLLPIHSPVVVTRPSSPPPLCHHLPKTRTAATSAISTVCSETSGDESLSSSPYDTGFTTPNLVVANTPSHFYGQEPISAKGLLRRIDPTEWTGLQLLLLQETSTNPKRNILTIHKTFSGEWDAQHVSNTWAKTILAEPIFHDLIVNLDILPHQLLLRKIVRAEAEEDFQRELHNVLLVHGPLSQLTVLQSTSPSLTVVWRVHHAFMDGYSARILRDKICYNLQGGMPAASPGPSFRDTVRKLDRLRAERREATRHFWDNKRAQFASAVGELCLSPQRVKDNALPSQRCITIPFPEAEFAAARARTGHTATTYFAAGWALTLSKFMDASQICFGMVFSGRDVPIPGVFDVVGPLINILPLFVQLPLEGDRETSVGAFLGCIQNDILGLNDVQHSDMREGFDRGFTSIMATQFDGEEEEQPLPVDDNNRPHMQSGFPLSLVVQEKQCQLQVFYSTAHFSEEDMNNVWSIFQNGVNCLLQSDDETLLAPIIRHELMPQEMEQTIRQWSNCESFETLDESKGDDLVTLFESVVARQPDAVAITRGHGQDVSYGDLDRAAAAVALKLSWIEPNESVCVMADRSVNWLVAIFGVLKAGGVYTPLHMSVPVSMRHANFVQSRSRVVVFPSSAAMTADTTPYNCFTIVVDNLANTIKTEARRGGGLATSYPTRHIARPDDLAYICFTSGSTGQPKAVQCTHKGLVAFQKNQLVRLSATKGTVVAQVMSPLFDGSIHEIFSALTHGATLRLASPEAKEHPFAHLQECDSAILTPSIANALDADKYPRLRNVYLVGEAVPQSVCDAWAKNRFLFNMYGPTEATCGATIKRLAPNKAVTLGHANPSSRVYILDRNQCLLPPGAVGELYLAGIQVSNGYINRPTENARQFLPDSVSPDSNQRMYKTGDFAYWDSLLGEICILGRKDRQIKLLGFRIDLDDLEARSLKAIPECGGAAIFRRDDHLVAAYQISSTSRSAFDELKIRKLLGEVLPPYTMPRRILAMPAFPLTVAGKLDYRKLEQMNNARLVKSQPQQKSMTKTEMMLVGAVRDLMKLGPSIPIDQDSDLRALGGHSIVQLRLASRISSLIGRHFSIRKVIDNPVISELASSVDDVTEEEAAGAQGLMAADHDRAGVTLGDNIVSPIERYWFSRHQKNLGTSSFNVSYVVELNASFNQHLALVSAWTTVMARHSILRCRFRSSTTAEGGVERFYAAEGPQAVYTESFDVRAAINTEFLLETEHPIRVLVSKHHMLVCASHIICDYETLDQLLKEFATSYCHGEGIETSLSASQRRYQDVTRWNVDVDPVIARFWRSYFSGIDVNNTPPYMKKARTSHHGESRMFQLSRGAMPSLEQISQSLHLTNHQIALGIVSMVLQAESPTKQDIILGSPYLGRQDEDMSTIGLFLQPLPIRVPRRSTRGDDLIDAPVADFLVAVQDSARSALSHGIGWSSLMNLLCSSGDENLRSAVATTSPTHPLFEAMVTFHERRPTEQTSLFANGTVPGFEPLATWAEGAKFGIMFEFLVVSSSVVTLRVEYDTSVFSAHEVLLMARRVDTTLECMCQRLESVQLRELEHVLLHVDGSVNASSEVKVVEFGTRLTALI